MSLKTAAKSFCNFSLRLQSLTSNHFLQSRSFAKREKDGRKERFKERKKEIYREKKIKKEREKEVNK